MTHYPPPAVTLNEPPPGINPTFYSNLGDSGAPVMYPPAGGLGYPPPAAEGHRPSQHYPAPMTNPPAPGAGYPTPGTNYPSPGMQPQNYLSSEAKKEFSIKNSMGQKIYTAKENESTDCCTGMGPLIRPFEMKIKNNADNEIIHLYRHLRCVYCCCPCCLQVMEVMSPPGTVIGTVVQEWSLLHDYFSVKNAAGETVLRIKGPLCPCPCCESEFKVLSKDGKTEVGLIKRQWSDVAGEAFKDADNFGITFPLELDVSIKAVLLGACMLIDFMFFERAKEFDKNY